MRKLLRCRRLRCNLSEKRSSRKYIRSSCSATAGKNSHARQAAIDRASSPLAGSGRALVLPYMRRDADGTQFFYTVFRVIGLGRAGRDAMSSVVFGFRHGLRGAVCGRAVGLCDCARNDKPVPVLHGHVTLVRSLASAPPPCDRDGFPDRLCSPAAPSSVHGCENPTIPLTVAAVLGSKALLRPLHCPFHQAPPGPLASFARASNKIPFTEKCSSDKSEPIFFANCAQSAKRHLGVFAPVGEC